MQRAMIFAYTPIAHYLVNSQYVQLVLFNNHSKKGWEVYDTG